MSTPNPLLGDSAARLAADRKRDEEVFQKRQEAQKKERAEQHARAVTDSINRIQRDLDRKEIELHAIQTETPRLKDRIGAAKRTERDLSQNPGSDEERTVRELTTTLENLERNEKDLERQLDTTKRDETRTKDELRRHTGLKDTSDRERARAKTTAEEDARVATRRLDDQEREARKLELEIRKMKDDISSLKREIR